MNKHFLLLSLFAAGCALGCCDDDDSISDCGNLDGTVSDSSTSNGPLTD